MSSMRFPWNTNEHGAKKGFEINKYAMPCDAKQCPFGHDRFLNTC